jgi:hypothetical protein
MVRRETIFLEIKRGPPQKRGAENKAITPLRLTFFHVFEYPGKEVSLFLNIAFLESAHHHRQLGHVVGSSEYQSSTQNSERPRTLASPPCSAPMATSTTPVMEVWYGIVIR